MANRLKSFISKMIKIKNGILNEMDYNLASLMNIQSTLKAKREEVRERIENEKKRK
jgi:hypothetical protein